MEKLFVTMSEISVPWRIRGHNIREAEVAESLLENSDKLLPDLCVLVERLKVVSLLSAGVTTHGANVDHSIAEFNEGAALDGDVEISNVVEDEVGKLLVLLLANELDEGVRLEGFAELEGSQAVLGEAEVEEGGDGLSGGLAQLLLLLGEVRATNISDSTL